jgi:predicted nucleotidyltransferase
MNLSVNGKLMLQRFFADRPVKKAYVFGSYARNEAGKESDIDLLVELDYSAHIGMKFFSYEEELENLLHKKVDIVTDDGVSPHIKPRIDKEKILIYERNSE